MLSIVLACYPWRRALVALGAGLGLLLGAVAGLALVRPGPPAAPLASWPAGPHPVAIAADPVAGLVYVAQEGDATVAALDEATGQMVGTLALRASPAALAFDPQGRHLYVARDDALVTVVDTGANWVLAALHAGSAQPAGNRPLQLAVDPTWGRAYVPDFDRDALAVVDAAGVLRPPLPVGHHPVAVAVDPPAGRLFVANLGDGTVSVLDRATGALAATVALGGQPVALAADASNGRVYVADYGRATVAVLDAATTRVLARVPVPPDPWALVVNPATHRVFVAHPDAHVVSVLGGGIPAVIATLPVGPRPVALAVDPATSRVYVADRTADDLTVIRDRAPGPPVVVAGGAATPLPADCGARCVAALHDGQEG